MMMGPPHAQEARNRPLNIPGHPETQPDTQRSLPIVGVGHLEDTQLGRFSAVSAIFKPLWSRKKALEEPKILVEVPLKI